MLLNQAKLFLQCLNAKNIQPKSDGKWLRCSCPLAYFTHENQKDGNPSFALSVEPGKPPHFNCFACESGSAGELLQMLEMYVKTSPHLRDLFNFKQAHEILDTGETEVLSLPEYTEFGGKDEKHFQAWPDKWLESWPKVFSVPLAMEYMTMPKEHINEFGQKCRGFPLQEVERFNLRYDHQRGMVIFPYWDGYGRLAGMRGRSITEKRHHDYTWQQVNNASLVWFNEKILDEYEGWVVVVEGQMDAMRVNMRWPKVVANLTAKPSWVKLQKLLSADGTLLIPDNDKTGDASIEKYREFHQQHKHPFKVLGLPATVKDPDDCNHDYLYSRIVERIDENI